MGSWDVIALGVSAAIGMSIFSVVAPATAVSGPGMLAALAIAAVPMIVFVVVYAFIGSAIPRSGSSYDWPAFFVHPYLGLIATWLRIVGNAGSLQLMAVVFVGYLSSVVAVPAGPTMVLVLAVFYVINLVGISTVGKVTRALVLLKIVVLGTFVIVGLSHVESGRFFPFLPHGGWAILAAVPLLVGLYTGIESAAEVGEEIRNSRAVIGKGLAIATGIGMLVYFGTSFVTIGVLGPAAVGSSHAPLQQAGSSFLGAWMLPLLLITALASIGAAMNATILIFSRFLFAMGRDGALPASLGRIHPRWGTPYVATTVVFILGLLALLLPDDLIFLFLAANIPTMLKYFSNCWSALRLVDRHPALHAAATIPMTRHSVRAWSLVGMACAIGIILAGLGADWRPYAILLAWGAVGSVYWFSHARHTSRWMRDRAATAAPVISKR